MALCLVGCFGFAILFGCVVWVDFAVRHGVWGIRGSGVTLL